MTRVKLEAFDAETKSAERIQSEADLEAVQLAAYEKGYTAGWDDCTSHKVSEEASLRSEVLIAIRNLAKEHKALQQDFLNTAEALFDMVVEKMMPDMKQQAIRQFVEKNLKDALEDRSTVPCLMVHPDMVDWIRSSVPPDADDVKIIGNEVFDPDQVEISFGDGGLAADFGKVFSMVRESIGTFPDRIE